MDHYQQQEHYEREPLDPSNQPYDSPSRRPPYQAYQPGPEYGFTDSPYYDSPHRRSNSNSPTRSSRQAGRYDSPTRREPEAPPPPRHGDYGYASRVEPSRHHPQHAASPGSYNQQPNITPGADNFSETAAGGMAGIAYTVADRNPRESGMDAARSTGGQVLPPPSRVQNPHLPRQTYSQRHSGYYPQTYAAQSQDRLDRDSRSSLNPFGTATNSSGGSRSSSRSPHVSMGDPYGDDPYQASTHSFHSGPRHGPTTLGMVDPNDILDDGDDGVDYGPPRGSHRDSMLSASVSDRGARSGIGAAAAVGAAAGGGASMGHMMTRPGYGNSDRREKSSDWLEQKDKRSKRWKWVIIVLVFLVIAGAIIGGVVGSLISNRKNANKESFNDDDKGDLSIDSSEIKKLLNNPDLHKVFPGMDYTPMNTQYPDCKENPPSQNNVTRDVAVLSQLTNTIRLYGTDCNQVQMVLHALKQLKMEDDIKLWMGVWQDDDDKTNKRQLEQMWDILDKYGDKPFKGIIMANEILFREQMTVSALGDLMADTRKKLSAKGLKLPVATSDLGNKWDKSLTDISDYVMANVHPFFSGTPADESAKWTLDYFKNNDETYLTDKTKGIIAETGWPTGGGTACPPPQTTCSQGSVAGIDGLNEFMDGWVCSSLEKNINYFWFSAFDEPWKVRFNTKGKEWEDKWGLMDVDRNIKKGVKIPDCGGKTI